jgi:hypothetical protein
VFIPESRLHLEPRNSRSTGIQISIKDLTGKSFGLVVRHSDTIENVRALFQHIKRIPDDQHSLIFAGEKLENYRTISDYNIKEHSELVFVIKLRTGV